MSSSPTISDTVIDNLITRKEVRADAIRRARARDKVEPMNLRRNMYNMASRINSMSVLTKSVIQSELDEDDFPEHIALVPDGNRRWSDSRGLSVGAGYAIGAEVIRDFREWSMVDNDVDVISAFLMSTENIERRPEDELAQLYRVFADFFNGVAEDEQVHENEIRHEVRGNDEAMDKLPEEVLDSIENMESSTASYDNKRFVFLLPYGGRDEIVRAARKTDTPIDGGMRVSGKGEDESEFRDNLILGDLPDADLMIRTSEVRLSNFMLYHNAYSEFVFLQKNWPSFTESDFYESIYKFSNRDRRFGV